MFFGVFFFIKYLGWAFPLQKTLLEVVLLLAYFLDLRRGLERLLGEERKPYMVQKSGEHQLRLIVYPIIYGSYMSGGFIDGFLNHQQY